MNKCRRKECAAALVLLALASGAREENTAVNPLHLLLGRETMPAAALAGPSGKNRDRAYTVDAVGKVTVLVLK
ncbi:MAG: hypothetical protein ABSF26_18415 [Thermoguttaceae bacterium]